MLPLASEKTRVVSQLASTEQDKTSCELRAENASTDNLDNNASNLTTNTTFEI